jgi:hypothetical protein
MDLCITIVRPDADVIFRELEDKVFLRDIEVKTLEQIASIEPGPTVVDSAVAVAVGRLLRISAQTGRPSGWYNKPKGV